MAKKKEEPQAVSSKQEIATSQNDLQGDTSEQKSAKPQDDAPKTNIIEPVAVDITLRDIHPHDSYGRCGLRFKKGETQRIAIGAFEPEALIALNDDLWLEVVYVTEK